MEKTINQLLDKIHNLTLDQMTEELGEMRQKLIDKKKQYGGLMKVTNTDQILDMIARATIRKTVTAIVPMSANSTAMVM